MPRPTNSRPFTLLEIAICISLLALIGGWIGVRAKEMLDFAHFKDSARALRSDLECFRSFAITYGAEVKLTLSQENEKWTYSIATDEPQTFFKSSPFSLAAVGGILWEKKALPPALAWTIDRSGRCTPSGTLTLQRKEADGNNSLKEDIVFTEILYGTHKPRLSR